MKLNSCGSIVLSGLFAVGVMATRPAAAADASLHLLKEIPVRDGGPWTAMAVDDAGRRLYAAHGGRIEVVNLDKDVAVGAITDTPEIRGLAIAPNFHMGFASSGKAQAVSFLDLNTLRTSEKMKTDPNPVAVVFDPSKAELLVFNPDGNSATAAEADDGDFLAKIDLGGKPSAATTDSKAAIEAKNGKVYAGIEDKNEVAVIDIATHKVTEHWPLAPGQSPRSLAFDAASHRLFVACDNKLLVLLDSASGKVIASAPIGDGAGDVVYDSATQNAFCATADGTVTIIQAESPDKLSVVQTMKTKPGAKVLGLDGKTHKIYVGSAEFAGARTNPVPNSSKIQVYGM